MKIHEPRPAVLRPAKPKKPPLVAMQPPEMSRLELASDLIVGEIQKQRTSPLL